MDTIRHVNRSFQTKLKDLEDIRLAYKAIFQKVAIAILVLKGEKYVDCNLEAENLFGMQRDKIIGQSPSDFSPEFQPDGSLSSNKAYQIIMKARNGHSQSFMWVHTRKNGERFIVKISLNSFNMSGREYCMAILDDITGIERCFIDRNILIEKEINFFDSKSDYEKDNTLKHSVETPKGFEKSLICATIKTEETERKRLAADIHDDIGPLLASLKMYTSILQNKLQGSEYSRLLDIIMNIIKETIGNVRNISNNISPHLVDRYGFAFALKSEIENLRLLLPIRFKSNISDLRFDGNTEIIVYRIVKELINNTLKHAKANQAEIVINYINPRLYIFYVDNGIGFDFPDVIEKKNLGHGLLNIDNRIKSVNGFYSIETSRGNGFRFSMEVCANAR